VHTGLALALALPTICLRQSGGVQRHRVSSMTAIKLLAVLAGLVLPLASVLVLKDLRT
jgi:hypothetical protein